MGHAQLLFCFVFMTLWLKMMSTLDPSASRAPEAKIKSTSGTRVITGLLAAAQEKPPSGICFNRAEWKNLKTNNSPEKAHIDKGKIRIAQCCLCRQESAIDAPIVHQIRCQLLKGTSINDIHISFRIFDPSLSALSCNLPLLTSLTLSAFSLTLIPLPLSIPQCRRHL